MGVNLVDANYPADCIDGKCLFNPDQYQYRIKGVKGEVNKPFVFPSAPIAGSSTPATQEMTSVVPTRTLSEDNSGREITSDQEGVGKMSKPILRRALSGVGSIKKGNIDALDVAIGEAQETKNLVSRFRPENLGKAKKLISISPLTSRKVKLHMTMRDQTLNTVKANLHAKN